ncbi:MAG TPA: hypothetical protein VJQ45_00570 [Ktedonobacterales bacterium]|nr:hypothetical protein [Ktedonobacterales bacterium]
MAGQQQDDQKQEEGMTSRVGLIEIDWPKTVGYYGGIGLALAFELIEPPVAAFIAFIPLFKLLSHPRLPMTARVVGQVLEGAAQPVGGADEATIHLADSDQKARHKKPRQGQRNGSSMWAEARAMADRQRQRRQQAAQQPQPRQAAG